MDMDIKMHTTNDELDEKINIQMLGKFKNILKIY